MGCSLGSSEWSSGFEVVIDFSGLGSGGTSESPLFSGLRQDLELDVFVVVEGELFSGILVHLSLLGVLQFLDSVHVLIEFGMLLFVVHVGEELVVMLVGEQLERVLVVHEEGGVSVSEVSKVSGEPVRLFNWAFVSQWGGEPGLQVHDHKLLEKSVSHHELLASSADISVAVVHSQGGIPSLVNLDSHEVPEFNIGLHLV